MDKESAVQIRVCLIEWFPMGSSVRQVVILSTMWSYSKDIMQDAFGGK